MVARVAPFGARPMSHNQAAMIEAHKLGRHHAYVGTSRAIVNDAASKLPTDEGDALLAGYYCELRRIAADRTTR